MYIHKLYIYIYIYMYIQLCIYAHINTKTHINTNTRSHADILKHTPDSQFDDALVWTWNEDGHSRYFCLFSITVAHFPAARVRVVQQQDVFVLSHGDLRRKQISTVYRLCFDTTSTDLASDIQSAHLRITWIEMTHFYFIQSTTNYVTVIT